MAQLTVRIPDDLNRALEAAAGRLERKRGEIVRIALRRFLGLEGIGRPADRVRDLLGTVESGVPDLAEQHRRYLLESMTRDA
jgi:metal-responsive CopG/Arc/MetJ family transcriptional regulator